MKKRILLVLLLLVARPVTADSATGRLEEQLEEAAGRERLEVLVDLAATYRKRAPVRSVDFGSEALELLRSLPDEQLELELSNTLCAAFLKLDDGESALPHAVRAEGLARSTGDEARLALALENLGAVYRRLDRYPRAATFSIESAELYEKLGDLTKQGAALNEAGIAYRRAGDYPRALELYFAARRAYKRAGGGRDIANVFNNIGIVYRELGQFDKALQFYRQALEIQERSGNREAVARLLNNIGVATKQLGDIAQAIDYYRRSLEIKRELGDDRGIAHTLNNIGLAYLELGDLEGAEEHFARSLEIKERLGDEGGRATTLLSLARVAWQRKQLEPAIETLEKSLTVAAEVGDPDTLQEIHRDLAALYAETGRYREAREAFERYEDFHSMLFNERNSRIIAEMEFRYEAEQMEQEIEILEQRQELAALERKAFAGGLALLLVVTLLLYNRYRLKVGSQRIIERKNLELEHYIAEVERKNAEMERFVYTVSHDLKSPLVTIRGFVGLVEKDSLAGDDERLRQDLDRIRSASGKMAELIDGLLDLSRIGPETIELEEVSMGQLAREVVDLLAGQISERRVEIDVAPGLPAAFGNRLRLRQVLQNLIANAVKFMGGQEHPRVEIAHRRQGDEVVYFVRDNGGGVDPRYQDKIFGLFERLDPEQPGTGVGLTVVQRIVEVHGGRIWVESEGEGRGSTFCFTLGAGPG